MELINTVIGVPLGYLMRFCWLLVRDYGIAIIIFTLLTKVIMFPISLLVQKNSIKMVKMKPQLEALRYQYVDDKDAYFDAQNALYKKEKYSPMAGIWPLLLQLPVILGLIIQAAEAPASHPGGDGKRSCRKGGFTCRLNCRSPRFDCSAEGGGACFLRPRRLFFLRQRCHICHSGAENGFPRHKSCRNALCNKA